MLMGGPDPPWPPAAPAEPRHWLRTTWRVAQAADAAGWRQLAKSTPLRLIRWLAIGGLVIWRWADGTPSSTAQWWPVLLLAVVLILPDMKGFSLFGSGFELAREAAEEARQEAEQAGQGAEQAKQGAVEAEAARRATAQDLQTVATMAEVIGRLVLGQAVASEVTPGVAEAEAETEPPAAASDVEEEFPG
jgi:hypothetical protein